MCREQWVGCLQSSQKYVKYRVQCKKERKNTPCCLHDTAARNSVDKAI